jgi:hypothetical protein
MNSLAHHVFFGRGSFPDMTVPTSSAERNEDPAATLA